MEVRTVLISSLECIPAQGHPVDQKTVGFVAQSMQVGPGLINPITVRPHPKDPRKYLVVAGRTRVAAARKLKWETIEAHVLEVFDDEEEFELVTLGENLWRTQLKHASMVAAVQRYWELWKKFAPEQGQHRAKLARPGGKANPEAEEEEPAEAKPTAVTPAKSFKKTLAAATGVSERTAKRVIQQAKAFDPEQLATFEALDTPQQTMEQLARVESKEARDQAVKLVASGMPPEAAIERVTAPESGEKSEAVLTDKEWLDRYCSAIRNRLRDTAAFDASASLYRSIRDARAEFKAKVGKKAQATAGKPAAGFFARLVNQLCCVGHPRDWQLCSACTGSGHAPLDIVNGQVVPTRCGKCMGDGFKVKFEEPGN